MPRRILLADDHDGIRRRVRSALEAAGFEICGEAVNGSEAIAKTKVLLPDLVIVNLSMPVMNGFEALTEISETGVKIVVYTVDDAPEIRRQVLSRGAHGYVSKSGPITDLIAEIQRVLRI
jgi:DNA-binding NarL/FixJ family response regulator